MLYLDNSGSMASVFETLKSSVIELGESVLFNVDEKNNPFQ
jgi:hypothetical protein